MGRFQKGNPGKPKGAKMKRQGISEFRATIDKAFTEEGILRTWTNLQALADQGDLNAIRYMHDRLYGRDANAGRALPAFKVPERVDGRDAVLHLVMEVFKAALRGEVAFEELAKLAPFAQRAMDTRDIEELRDQYRGLVEEMKAGA